MKMTVEETITRELDINLDVFCASFPQEFEDFMGGAEPDDADKREFVMESLYIMGALDFALEESVKLVLIENDTYGRWE